jgi:hypothetical protein
MKEETVTTTTRISLEVYKWLSANYGTSATGARACIGSYMLLRKRTLAEMAGLFDRQELHGLRESVNKRELVHVKKRNPEQLIKSLLIAHLQDGEAQEMLSGRCGFDFEALLEKLRALTEAQGIILTDRLLESIATGEALEALAHSFEPKKHIL